MILCKDCKHAKRSYWPDWKNPMNFATCLAAKPIRGDTDLLTGKVNPARQPYCSNERSFWNACGKEGKNYEAKS